VIGTREPPQEPRRPAGRELLLLAAVILGGVAAVTCARADDGADFPAHWWTPVPREGAPQWEVLPQEAGPGFEAKKAGDLAEENMRRMQGVRATFHRDMTQIASKRTLAILAAGGALAGVCALVEDPAPGVDAREGHWWDASSDVGNTAGNVATIGAVIGTVLLVGHLSGSESLTLTGSELARSVIYSAGITLALKAATQRTRPNGEPYSFPSGHSAAMFSVAPVLAARYGILAAAPAYLLAGVTAFGRVEEREHFPSDVVFGAALGLASGVAVVRSDAASSSVSITVRPGAIGLTTRF